MTVIQCPHGCGGTVDTTKEMDCPSCRRGLNETEVVLAEDCPTEETYWGPRYVGSSPTSRKLSWCWEWWGPADHRMRCRLPKGHSGEHHDHEQRSNSMIISTDGDLVATGK